MSRLPSLRRGEADDVILAHIIGGKVMPRQAFSANEAAGANLADERKRGLRGGRREPGRRGTRGYFWEAMCPKSRRQSAAWHVLRTSSSVVIPVHAFQTPSS